MTSAAARTPGRMGLVANGMVAVGAFFESVFGEMWGGGGGQREMTNQHSYKDPRKDGAGG